jgi:acetylornithine deacetylase/succinyl-diaminopimelate desuccinylase-like protein
MLMGHLDTVYPDGTAAARPMRFEGAKILGPGVCDMKGGLLVGMYALRALQMIGFKDFAELAFFFNSDEEIGSPGSRPLYAPVAREMDAALVLESGRMNGDIVGARKGSGEFTLTVMGRAAHAGVEPEKGIPAITIAAEAVLGMPQGRVDFETTGNVGTIRGGLVRNAVPEECVVEGEMRSMEFEKVETLVSSAKTHLGEVQSRHPGARVDATFHLGYPGYKLAPGDPAADLVFGVLRELGMEPDPHPVGGGTDGNVFRGHGISSVVIGRGGYNQHTKDEYLVIPEMLDCARVVEAIVRKAD